MSVLYRALASVGLGLFAAACSPGSCSADGPSKRGQLRTSGSFPAAIEATMETATFAGGCFWCMEPPFEGLIGVYDVVSGYSGGSEKDPSYKQVSSGRTGHAESVQVSFAPDAISYRKLVEIFLRSMDPTDGGGQFADRGKQYRPAIFYRDEAQKRAAQEALGALEKSGRFHKPLAVEVTPFGAFYPAEDYHQDYYRTHPKEYKRYRKASGRSAFLERIWGQDIPELASRYRTADAAALRARLSPLEFDVTQHEATEPPFKNRYWNNRAQGIYVDVVSGEPLFSSQDKFKSGTGWPSFTRPLFPSSLVLAADRSAGVTRTEVRSKHAGSHLGHVFDDGPAPTGLRYCMNSAALRFVSKDQLQKEGLGYLRALFEKAASNRRPE